MNATISLAMIVRDSSATLEKCLSTCRDIVDEMVIVDTGSQDDTVDIAKKFTDKVFFFEWIDDFSAARNFSFSKCTKEWVLWCFHPDTKVNTSEGLKPISQISVGDKVLTHSGVYKKVTKIYCQDYDGKIVKFETPVSNQPIRVTPNHEFYSCKGYKCRTGVKLCSSDCGKQWSKRKLKTSTNLTRQCKQGYKDYQYTFTPIADLSDGDIVAYPRRKQDIFSPLVISLPSDKKCMHKLPDRIEVTPEFMRLLGYYVAEGTYGGGHLNFCFHAKETVYHDDVLFLMNKIFKIKGTKNFKNGPDGGGCTVRFCSTPLAKFFNDLVSGLQPNRHIPMGWLGLSDDHLKEFVKGYYFGDGGEVKDGSFAITTSSLKLVYQIREILGRFGICPYTAAYTTKKAWKVFVGGAQKKLFEEIIGEQHDKYVGQYHKNKYHYSTDNFIHFPIRNKTEEFYKGKVYNLEVEEDHTYVIENVLCHNCDSDDYMVQEDVEKVKKFDFSQWDIIIAQYQYAHDECGRSTCTVPRERFVRRSLGLQWEGEIHEYLPIIGKGRTHISDISTHHNKQHGSSERNLAILERVTAKNPNARNLYYLGKEYHEFGRTDDAIKYLTMFVERGDGFWEDIYKAHYDIAMCYQSKANDDLFKRHMLESIRIEERRAEPFYQMAYYYHMKNQWDKAIQWYEACLSVRRPKDLLASYQPEYYSWLPALQLCVCYNAIGDIERAYSYNKKVLEYRPQDSRAIGNERILREAIERKPKSLKNGEGKKLHLGCGGKIMPGYVNVDLFKGNGVDEVFSMEDVPYEDNTISSVYSEHSLEHLPFTMAEKAIKEWYRVLRPGGELMLYIPDFERCCQSYLSAPLEHKTFMKTRAWFKSTIYGIQKSQAGEEDDAQVHKSGFSKEEMKIVLERNGFLVDYISNYGGSGEKPDYGTPSFAARAVKPLSSLKFGWIAPENYEAAQTRIRVLNLHRWFLSRGYRSKIVNYPEIINQNYDVAIVGKAFDESHFTNIKWLKRYGKTVFCDICEQILDFPYVKEILSVCDKVICCSDALADKVRPINPNVVVIEDAWEL